ncbi:MAG: ABC transporter ATP-binding protein [Clostridia bacterium]|nr:ABC transporter ATP-binding protein [Clostridia bacterium]
MKERKKLISCADVAIGYDNLTAVSGVTFDVYEGDDLCIVGENGSGKSSLLKGMLGLLPLRSGKIELCGISRAEMGYLPQQTAAQRDFPASVGEVVISGFLGKRGMLPFYSKEQRAAARKNMERMGILPLADVSYRELSGGQQQRVMLARALCASGKLLLLDEPMTGLDPLVSGELYEIIGELNRSGIAIIMISHDIYEAVHRADHILHMDTTMRFFGSAHDYKHSDVGLKFLGRCDQCSV